jgi:hypothetical protein
VRYDPALGAPPAQATGCMGWARLRAQRGYPRMMIPLLVQCTIHLHLLCALRVQLLAARAGTGSRS